MDIQTILFLYLLFTIGGLGALFLIKGKKRLKLHPQELRTCEYCLSPFLVDTTDKIPTCPQCGSKNLSNIH